MRWLLLASLTLLASCSSYHLDYEKAAKNFKEAKDPAGPWQGTWKSEVNGHHGPLWCLVSRDPQKPNDWKFRYRAGWGILKFGDYTHPVNAPLKPNGTLPLDDKMTLPNNFGTYAVKGTITPKDFKVRYQGNGDKGTMTLARPQ
ncbi:MAG: hypothetical protein ACSHYF_17140 [Verrucomicrobiaceae bacterium]